MSKKDFAFIVHSRDRTDLPRKFPILRFLPNSIFDWLTRILPPIIVSNITGLTRKSGQESVGLIIGVPMTASQLIENRELALKRILQAIKLAQSYGVKYIGLGAMTSSLTKGGKDVVEHIPDVVVTTGRTYTVKNITDYIFYCLNLFNLKKDDMVIGIVGAGGGIGMGVAIMLAKSGFKHFVLIDLERKLERVRDRIINLEKDTHDLTIKISHKVSIVSECHIIVAATSAPEVVIRSEDVSSGTIIINDAQPSDISPDIITNRRDVLVLEGGVLSTPNINCHFNMGLPHKTDIFSCLAETLLLVYRDSDRHYSIEEFDINFLNDISIDAKKLNFSIKPPQNTHGLVSEDYIKEFSYHLLVRNSQN